MRSETCRKALRSFAAQEHKSTGLNEEGEI